MRDLVAYNRGRILSRLLRFLYFPLARRRVFSPVLERIGLFICWLVPNVNEIYDTSNVLKDTLYKLLLHKNVHYVPTFVRTHMHGALA
jgi:hypothetical protein